jgi:hypothetical protein
VASTKRLRVSRDESEIKKKKNCITDFDYSQKAFQIIEHQMYVKTMLDIAISPLAS